MVLLVSFKGLPCNDGKIFSFMWSLV